MKKKAFVWFRKAAVQGYETAQYSLALCYETGDGCEKDEKKAFEWYKKASEQGNEKATQWLINRVLQQKYH